MTGHSVCFAYLYRWDDFTTLILAREKTLRDFLYKYWKRFVYHLLNSDEGLAFQQSWNAYLIITLPNSWMRSLRFRSNSKFPRRLINQATHCMVEWLTFEEVHRTQYDIYRNSNKHIEDLVYKFFTRHCPDDIDEI